MIPPPILWRNRVKKPKFTEKWMPDYQVENILELYTPEIVSLPGLVVEFGCWQGFSTHLIMNHIYPEKLQVVDHFLGNVDESPNEITVVLAKERDIEKEFKSNMKLTTQQNYLLHKQDCITWLENLEDTIKFCHIDASHDYDSVKTTIDLILDRMEPGGLLTGDDFRKRGVSMAVADSFAHFETDGHNLWWYQDEK